MTDLAPDVNQFRLRVGDHRFSSDPGQHAHVHADAADSDGDGDEVSDGGDGEDGDE